MDKNDSNDNLLKSESNAASKNDAKSGKTADASGTAKVELQQHQISGPGYFTNPTSKNSNLSQNTSNGEASKINKSKKESDPKADVKTTADVKTAADDKTEADEQSSDGGNNEQMESMAESASICSTGSNQGVRTEGHERIVNLCIRGEWATLDQQLRAIKRGHPSLSKRDAVRI